MPADDVGHESSEHSALPPVVLRFPDLDEPEPSAEPRDWVATLEPLVTKVLLGGIAVLGLVLLVLMWRGVGSSTAKTSSTTTPLHGVNARPFAKSTNDSSLPARSTTPVAPFRLPMVETAAEARPSTQPPVEWPTEDRVLPENPQQQTSNTSQRDVPPDMPRYAPSTVRPDLQGPELGAAAIYGPEDGERMADQRAAIINPYVAPAGQPGVARFKDTIDTPNLEPSYDGTRSRFR
jgi:hypothetical protein